MLKVDCPLSFRQGVLPPATERTSRVRRQPSQTRMTVGFRVLSQPAVLVRMLKHIDTAAGRVVRQQRENTQ